MQFPVDIHIGSVTIPIHALCEVLAFFVGFRYYLYLRKHQTDLISSENRLIILVGAAAGALIFSRLVGGLENPEQFFSGDEGWLYYYGSKTIVGGLLGGLMGVEIAKKIIGVTTSSGDLFTYPIILAMIIGRIGCFLTGVKDGTYGIETDFFMGMDLGDGIKRHPTSLYEIFFWIALWIIIYVLNKKTALANGSMFKILMTSYLFFRFLIEFIKPFYHYEFGLNTIQIICILGLLYYYKVWLKPSTLIDIKTYA